MIVTFGPFASPDNGIAVRSVMVARCLVRMGVTVDVFSVEEVDSTSVGGENGGSIDAANVGTSDQLKATAISTIPRFALGARSRRLLRYEARRHDALIVESALLLPALWLAGVRRPIIWDTTELESLHYARRPKTLSVLAKRLMWNVLERWSVRKADVVVSISTVEASEWSQRFPACMGKLMVADHAVLTDPVRICESELNRHGAVVFVGTLRAKQNRIAAEWIIQRLAPQLEASQARIVMAGRDTDLLTVSSPNVKLLGFVEDLSGIIAGASICIAPLHTAAGTSTKILDYIRQGSRVLATPVAAVGLDDCPGITVASLEEFPAVLGELLANPESAQQAASRRMAQEAWYEEHCGQAHLIAQWRAILERVGISLGDE